MISEEELHDLVVSTIGSGVEKDLSLAETADAVIEILRPLMNGRIYQHRQIFIPTLGFSVDEGLEELIQLCWRRGIATFVSCIGTDDWHNGDASIGFIDFGMAERWEALTGSPVEWNQDETVASSATAYFLSSAIPELCRSLER